ncbi:PadR family transcriptional regulator [Companilactobacillus sp. HBUAS56275]|uniref:PadR family transcriptional regulator n=1 Tax=Candidatus Companilactobacillus pullicola TaxID=2838523 RepID=A0A9D1ZP24_9LACO|nr:PadR family transcriptional regulator [Candidatus Companilactobacillus pullicola]
MNSQLKKGLLDVCVLAELRNSESYGYAIIRDLEPMIEISESTLYPILKRLLAKKAITVTKRIHNNRIRKYYKITDIGENEITEFLNDWHHVEKIVDYVRGGDINE